MYVKINPRVTTVEGRGREGGRRACYTCDLEFELGLLLQEEGEMDAFLFLGERAPPPPPRFPLSAGES